MENIHTSVKGFESLFMIPRSELISYKSKQTIKQQTTIVPSNYIWFGGYRSHLERNGEYITIKFVFPHQSHEKFDNSATYLQHDGVLSFIIQFGRC